MLKMRGKGIKRLNTSQRGAQLINLKVQIPKKLTPKQMELMVEFAKEEEEMVNAGTSSCRSHSFTQTVKDTIHRLSQFLQGADEDSKKQSK